MSLAALALRLAAVEALCPAAAHTTVGAVFPTLAGRRVADSLIAPRDEADPETRLPFLAVYVEDARGRPDGENHPTFPLEIELSLVVECEVKILDRDPETGELDEIVPETDPAAEAMLDILAAQVLRSLEVAPSGALFRKIRQRIVSVESVPLRDAMLGVRFARRTMKITVALFGETWEGVAAGELPEPLATVAAALPAGSYGAGLVELVRDALDDPEVLPRLEAIVAGFGIGARPESLETAPAGLSVDL